MRVQNVITDQGNDIAPLINAVAGDYADAFTGVLFAESGLDEYAHRDTKWPDYSSGLSQVIAANLGYGTFSKRPSPERLAEYDNYMYVAENAIKEGWRYYEAALKRMGGDVLWAALSYNRGPSYTRAQLEQQVATDPAIARRLEHYRQSLALAEQYREPEPVTEIFLDVSDEMRAKLKDVGDYPILNSDWLPAGDQKAEKSHGTKGYYLSSPVDGWVLHGPFAEAE